MKVAIIEKPSIPQFVADWLENLYDDGGDWQSAIGIMFDYNGSHHDKPIYDWFVDNKDKFIIASMYGYNIKQEPKYYARIKGWELATSKNTFWNYRHIVERPILSKLYVGSNESIESFYTIERWNEIGINDTNADFKEVEVWEVDISATHENGGENGK